MFNRGVLKSVASCHAAGWLAGVSGGSAQDVHALCHDGLEHIKMAVGHGIMRSWHSNSTPICWARRI